MKLFLYRLPFIALLIVIQTSLAQVIHPTPHILQVENYSFTGWPSNTTTEYPAAFLGWVGPKQVVLASGNASTTAQATGNAALSQSNTTGFVVTGIFNEGSYGLSIQSTGPGNGPMAIVFAVDTRNTSGITLTWDGGTWSKTANGNPAGIQLQYRVGTTGNWTNVGSHKVLSPDGFVETIPFSYTLPSSLENQPVVQFRWLYFSQVSEPVITARDGMQVDDIAVTATTRQPFSIPDAGFSYAVSGTTINFTDTSKNRPIAWDWDFGDGNTSTVQNPQNMYANPGTYDVRLIAINPAGEDTIIQTVTIQSKPEADFGYNSNGLIVNFEDLSTNSPTAWEWDFGDTNTSADQSPQHTYATDGTYDVRLIATNISGSDTVIKQVTVSLTMVKPEAEFNYNSSGLSVNFTDESLNIPTSWEWDFGDGSSSTDQNPQHTYAAGGTYDVRLIASNAAGEDTVIKSVTVSPLIVKPEADFDYTAVALDVTFEDQSTNLPTSWEWDFGDGGTSTDQNPNHTYSTATIYSVRLISGNAAGTDTVIKQVSVTSTVIAPVADFTFVENNRVVDFTDASANYPTSWEWDFGDGNTSNLEDPQHTYLKDSTYNVCLKVINSAGEDSVCQSVTVKLGIADLRTNRLTIYPNPSTGVFNLELEEDFTNSELVVVNLLGETVKTMQIGQKVSQVDLSNMQKGLYLIRVNSDGKLYTGKINLAD